jgi:hypothetical protein
VHRAHGGLGTNRRDRYNERPRLGVGTRQRSSRAVAHPRGLAIVDIDDAGIERDRWHRLRRGIGFGDCLGHLLCWGCHGGGSGWRVAHNHLRRARSRDVRRLCSIDLGRLCSIDLRRLCSIDLGRLCSIDLRPWRDNARDGWCRFFDRRCDGSNRLRSDRADGCLRRCLNSADHGFDSSPGTSGDGCDHRWHGHGRSRLLHLLGGGADGPTDGLRSARDGARNRRDHLRGRGDGVCGRSGGRVTRLDRWCAGQADRLGGRGQGRQPQGDTQDRQAHQQTT